MNLDKVVHWRVDRLPTPFYKVMAFLLTRLVEPFSPASRQVAELPIEPGITVVDYGCGPGRFIAPLSRVVGEAGTVYAVDVHELALRDVQARIERLGLSNVKTALVTDQRCGVPDGVADVVISFDVVHMVTRRDLYYREMRRLIKPGGVLVTDSGHLPSKVAKAAIVDSGCFDVVAEKGCRFICRPC